MLSTVDKHLISVLIALLVPCLLVAGCGGSSDDSGPPLTQKQYVSQGNEICVEATKERGEASKELAKDADGEEVSSALLEPVSNMTEELESLTPPKKQQKQADAMISAFEDGIAKVEKDPGGGGTATAFGPASQLAIEAGLTDCII